MMTMSIGGLLATDLLSDQVAARHVDRHAAKPASPASKST